MVYVDSAGAVRSLRSAGALSLRTWLVHAAEALHLRQHTATASKILSLLLASSKMRIALDRLTRLALRLPSRPLREGTYRNGSAAWSVPVWCMNDYLASVGILRARICATIVYKGGASSKTLASCVCV